MELADVTIQADDFPCAVVNINGGNIRQNGGTFFSGYAEHRKISGVNRRITSTSW